MKKILGAFALIIFITAILALTVRGLPGNPSINDLASPAWKEGGPLELSPDRGRFALLYSLVEEKSLHFSLPLARFATPDVGYHNGHYVSLFAPGLSFLAAPGYLFGKYLGASQVGAFATIAVFAVLNAWLIYWLALHCKATRWAAALGALTFTFGSPAFTYAVTLYQHHISTFLILASIYSLLRWKNWWSLALTWLLVAAAIPLDYPNLILMLPVALLAFGRILALHVKNGKLWLKLNFLSILTLLAAGLPLLFFVWFNQASYGNPWQLAGTVTAVKAIDDQGNPTAPLATGTDNLGQFTNPTAEKKAVNFFQSRYLLNGFYVHFFSLDRGLIVYAPVVLYGILGLWHLYKRAPATTALLVATIGANALLYSMWGDPWGGWAFGSRYLIPSYALLSIGVAVALSVWRKKWWLLLIFFLLFAYSVGVNTLGALSTSANPPQSEVLALEKLSGRPQPYTYQHNYAYLTNGLSKSFVWQTIGSKYLSAWHYYQLLVGLIVAVATFGLIRLYRYGHS